MVKKKANRKIAAKKQPKSNVPVSMIVTLICVGISLTMLWMSIATPDQNTINGSVQDIMRGLTGNMFFVLPLLLSGLGIYQFITRRKGTFSVITCVSATMLALLLLIAAEVPAAPEITKEMYFPTYFNFAYKAYGAQIGGGCLGSLAWFFYQLFGVVGGMIAVIALIVADIAILGRNMWGSLIASINRADDARKERRAIAQQKKEQAEMFKFDDFKPTAGKAKGHSRVKPVRDPFDDDITTNTTQSPRRRRTPDGSGIETVRSRNVAPSYTIRTDKRPVAGDNLGRFAEKVAPSEAKEVPGFIRDRSNPRTGVGRGEQNNTEPEVGFRPSNHTSDTASASDRTRERRSAYTNEAHPSDRPVTRTPQPARASRIEQPETASATSNTDLVTGMRRMRPIRSDAPVDGNEFAGGHMHTVHGDSVLKGGSIHVKLNSVSDRGVGAPPPLDFDDDEEGPNITVEVPEYKDDEPVREDHIPMAERDLSIEPDQYEPDIPLSESEETAEPVDQKKQLGVFRKHKAAEEEKEPYAYPPLDLLAEGNADQQMDTEEADLEKAQELEDTLRSFNVDATLSGIAHGPAVTRFEFKLPRGVKVGKITSLADDIAYSLAAESVRIEAPIPGKTAVGVEIPNDTVETVPLRDVLESKDAVNHPSKIAVGLGKDNAARHIMMDIAKMPHLLIAGQTGSGKSVCINSIIVSILFRAAPDEVKLIMIDPKVVELSVYNGVPHLIAPVVTDPKKAASALDWAVVEMGERYKKFSKAGVRNIKGYNSHLPEGEEKMPQIVIIIDELADLMMAAPGEVEDSVCRLAQLARAAGMHLIIATQRPSVNVITGVIKANIPSRIAFKVASGTDSRTIFDHVGAEKLLGNGDMLFVPSGISKPLRIQGAWVSDEEVENVVEYIKARYDNNYDEDMIEHMNRSNTSDAERDEVVNEDCDDRLEEAVEIVIDSGQASISMLQRKMRVGYARAGRLIDEMCRRGIVSEADGAKPRSVLITKEEFRNAFMDDDED